MSMALLNMLTVLKNDVKALQEKVSALEEAKRAADVLKTADLGTWAGQNMTVPFRKRSVGNEKQR